MILFTN